MKIDVKNIDLWSKMGSRATFGMCLLEIQKEFDNLQVVTSDVSTSAGLDRFKKNYSLFFSSSYGFGYDRHFFK